MKNIFIVTFILFFFSSPALFAAGGKIIGKVTDESSGDALFNANVLIVGTSRGAVSDVSGKYVIDNVPAGKYTLRATIIGYEAYESKSVEIKEGGTVTVNMKMKSSSVQIKGVEIMGEGNIVNVRATASTKTLSSKAIEQIPNVKSVQDVMQLQAGAVKLGNNVFLRGGRANEVQYIVDGISVNDVLGGSSGTTQEANEQISQFNSGVGNSISASGLSISTNAIQTLSVTTSGMDAEYGNAQSGVINIVTKSGSENYTGSLQVRNDKLRNATSFNESYYSVSFGGPEPLTSRALPEMGIDIPGKLTFFISSDFSQDDGPFNYNNNDFYHPIQRDIQMQGVLGDIFRFSYHDRLSNAFTFNGKMRYDYSSSDQISYAYRANFGTYHDYRHVWKNLADSSRQNENISEQHSIQWTHFLGADSYFRLQGSVLTIGRNESVAGLTPPYYSTITNSKFYDPSRDGFYDLGTSQSWKDNQTKVSTIKFDLVSPVNKNHFLKTGFELNLEEILSTEISYPLGKITVNNIVYRAPYPDSIRHDTGLFPGYGVYRWNLLNYPQTGSMYVQDNMKFFGANLHVGLRYDYLYVGNQVFSKHFVTAWKDATGLEAKWVNNKTGSSALMYALTRGEVSPRLAINFPITERIGFFFNYGHFLQFPERNQYFRTPFIVDKDITVGNPNLKPQRTVQYESGFENQLTDDLAIGLRGFYKDIFDYVTVIPAEKVKVNLNSDFASSRGFEVTLSKGFSYHFSGNISYSYQIAKGRSSNPFQYASNQNFQLPREIRLDWDQRNTVNVLLGYRVEHNEDYTLLGLPFINNWGASLTWSYGSGFPYTPSTQKVSSFEDAYKQNTADGPNSSIMNFSFYKNIPLVAKLSMTLTLDILNVLNEKNVTSLGEGFNVNFGRPYQYGDFNYETREIYQWYKMPGILPPYIYGNPRQILLGMKVNFGS
jgi:outer membrane receptor protein involved in Fe transport